MKDLARELMVRGREIRLKDRKPDATPGWKDKEEAAERIAGNLARIDLLQFRLYAEGQRSLLIVIQGMDASGKDGLIRRVMNAFNPQACRVWAFKAPTAEELSHDFLWRIHQRVPPRGGTAIFNRSHYEDVLVVRVRELVPKDVWSRRYDRINRFERDLHEEGTRVLKFFLHISPEEQLERLLTRLDEPDKRWKFNEQDIEERARWADYQRAYEDVLVRCSTAEAPWFVVPADRKWYRDLAVSEIVARTLEEMDPKAPKVDLDVKRLRSRLVATRVSGRSRSK